MILADRAREGEILEEGEVLLKRPVNRFSRTQRRMSSKNGAHRTASPTGGLCFSGYKCTEEKSREPDRESTLACRFCGWISLSSRHAGNRHTFL